MKRRAFVVSSLALVPIGLMGKVVNYVLPRTRVGFVVKSGDARFGTHFDMKGVTKNTLDIKISGKDTDGEIAVFEQTGHTAKGGPPLHIHLFQDEWFYVIQGKYKFQVGEEIFYLSAGDTIFLPKNVQHAFVQLTKKAKMTVTYLPAGKPGRSLKT